MNATVDVRLVEDRDPFVFDVAARDENSETRHRVTLARKDFARLAAGADANGLVEASFRFLLDREPKEAILAGFDVSVIARYFPEFERKLPDYLSKAHSTRADSALR